MSKTAPQPMRMRGIDSTTQKWSLMNQAGRAFMMKLNPPTKRRKMPMTRSKMPTKALIADDDECPIHIYIFPSRSFGCRVKPEMTRHG
jgi:hypothetical protein